MEFYAKICVVSEQEVPNNERILGEKNSLRAVDSPRQLPAKQNM